MQYETSQIYAVEVVTGAIREVVSKAGAWGKPVVSPDGRTVVPSFDRTRRPIRTG